MSTDEFCLYEDKLPRRYTNEEQKEDSHIDSDLQKIFGKRNSVHSEKPANQNFCQDLPSRNKNKGLNQHKYTVGKKKLCKV